MSDAAGARSSMHTHSVRPPCRMRSLEQIRQNETIGIRRGLEACRGAGGKSPQGHRHNPYAAAYDCRGKWRIPIRTAVGVLGCGVRDEMS